MNETTRKIALVTGAARRVGRAIALALGARGYDIGLHYHRSADDAQRTADEIRALGRRVALLPADLADARAACELPERCTAALGGLSALVNNASVFSRMTLNELTPAAWNETLAINLTAPALLSRHAATLLVEGGAIVNVCDVAAERPFKAYLAYSVSKAGLVALTRATAVQLAPRIRVNGVSPGVALWPEDYSDDLKRRLTARIPAMRAGSPDEISAAVAFLVADATYVTGVILPVDGARSIAF